jgi:hypothetical protein
MAPSARELLEQDVTLCGASREQVEILDLMRECARLIGQRLPGTEQIADEEDREDR